MFPAFKRFVLPRFVTWWVAIILWFARRLEWQILIEFRILKAVELKNSKLLQRLSALIAVINLKTVWTSAMNLEKRALTLIFESYLAIWISLPAQFIYFLAYIGNLSQSWILISNRGTEGRRDDYNIFKTMTFNILVSKVLVLILGVFALLFFVSQFQNFYSSKRISARRFL